MIALALIVCALLQDSQIQELRPGEPVQGVITDASAEVHTPTLDESYTDAPVVGLDFRVQVSTAGTYTIELRSYAFDAYLVLRDEAGALLTEDDDGLVATDARVVTELAAGSAYMLSACALPDSRGPFELTLSPGAPAPLDAEARRRAEDADAQARLAWIEREYGPESLELASALNSIGDSLWRDARHAEAEPLYKRALAIDEKALGPEHPDVATDLNNLASLYHDQGRYAEAEPLYERALAIDEKALGPDHPDVATSLSNLAVLYKAQGRYAEAEPLYERALAIDEKAFGPEHPDVATSLNNLASLYHDQGRYAEAEPLVERARAIREKALGPEHPAVATSLNNLALLYQDQGRYAEAEPLYERALAIDEKALGPEHPDVATSLNNLASLYHDQGRYAEAEPLVERARAIREKALGPEHPAVATSLNNLARLYDDQGRYAEAEPLYVRALAIFEKALGPDHPDVATSLSNLAVLYKAQGRYAEAEPLYERALAIREKAFGPEHPDVATSLNNLASLYHDQGRYAEAEPLVERARAIREKALGPEHPAVATSLNNLALLYQDQGRYAEAEPLHERALAIREKALGPEHPDVATDLNNLALLYKAQGRYAEAEPVCERALAIRERSLGPEHPEVATSLNNLAFLYHDQGRYAEAEPLYERALAIDEKAFGPEHPDVATSLNNLASLYHDQGRYAEAEPLVERARAIREKALGPEHPAVATSLNNLALLYQDQGRYAEAEPLHERALAIREKALGPEHPDVATDLNNLALLYKAQGRYAEAEPLYVRALAIFEKALGPEHPHVATSLNNLAFLYHDQGRYAEAEPLYERALAIQEKAFGPEHPDVATDLNNLAWLYKALGRYAEAEPLFERALRGTLEHLDRELPVMSESDRFQLLAQAEGPQQMLATGHRLEGWDRAAALDLCLAWKGKVTRLQAASLALGRRADDPAVRQRIGRLQGLQKELSDLVLLPLAERAEDHAERVAALREARLALERSLNRELGIDAVLAMPTVGELRAALPADAVLVDFYVGKQVFAWVLQRDVEPQLVALGDAEPLRAAQEALLRASVTRGLEMPAEAQGDPGADLRALLWEPLREAVGDARTVLVSPDGFLCELPLGILPDVEGRYLIERHRFVYLSDPTRLLACDGPAAEREGPVLAVGDVNYFKAEEPPPEVKADTRSRFGSSWGPLDKTRDELNYLRGLHGQALEWQAPFVQLEGKAATEEAVRSTLPGQRYVHLATHGYFEPDELPSLMANAEREGMGKLDLGVERRVTGLLPGLLTGLVFAGANARPGSARDDGYLTAEEIQYLDLSSCDLAVLSACETSLGSKRAGNGLMSLRRAFEVAGAKTVVSSLWKVNDRAAAELMKGFYENYLLHDLPKAEALHQAKLALLRRNRAENGGDGRPSTWGAFVLSGDFE